MVQEAETRKQANGEVRGEWVKIFERQQGGREAGKSGLFMQ